MFNFRCTKRMDRLKGFGFEASKLLKNGCKMGLRLIYFGSLKAGSFLSWGFWLSDCEMEKQQTWTGARVTLL